MSAVDDVRPRPSGSPAGESSWYSSRVTRTALITGCSSGIGRATALHLAARGWLVYATARRPDTLGPLDEAGCRTLALDVTDEMSMRSAVEQVQDAHGAVDALVNNAGYSQSGALETMPIDQVRRQFETNVYGLLRLCQLVLPGMRARGDGRIVNLSSMGGRLAFPGGGAYHASKYAVEALSDVLRFEVARFGVHVVVIEPGLIRSSFGRTAAAGVGRAPDGPYQRFDRAVAEATERVYTHGPLARLGGPPEAVARVIEHALTAPRPRPRYRVTPSARMLITTRRLLPDRAWDAVMRAQFPQPGAG
jgi:NAD(P)-dependent dehydrogenase (short-subunit alcohol dehydrogenase family)